MSSIISNTQYLAYCRGFNHGPAIDETHKRPVRGIGGSRTGVGTELVQIPITIFGIVLHVKCPIMDDNIPSLLSLKYILHTDLYMSIAERTVKNGGNHKLFRSTTSFLLTAGPASTSVTRCTPLTNCGSSIETLDMPPSRSLPTCSAKQTRNGFVTSSKL